jgi:hypothetical protein
MQIRSNKTLTRNNIRFIVLGMLLLATTYGLIEWNSHLSNAAVSTVSEYLERASFTLVVFSIAFIMISVVFAQFRKILFIKKNAEINLHLVVGLILLIALITAMLYFTSISFRVIKDVTTLEITKTTNMKSAKLIQNIATKITESNDKITVTFISLITLFVSFIFSATFFRFVTYFLNKMYLVSVGFFSFKSIDEENDSEELIFATVENENKDQTSYEAYIDTDSVDAHLKTTNMFKKIRKGTTPPIVFN